MWAHSVGIAAFVQQLNTLKISYCLHKCTPFSNKKLWYWGNFNSYKIEWGKSSSIGQIGRYGHSLHSKHKQQTCSFLPPENTLLTKKWYIKNWVHNYFMVAASIAHQKPDWFSLEYTCVICIAWSWISLPVSEDPMALYLLYKHPFIWHWYIW